MWLTAHLSVSREGLDCAEVSRALARAGIASSVTANTSIQCSASDGCWLESGCRVVQSVKTSEEVARTWKALKLSFDLGCAHLWIPGVHSGCVLDFLRPSVCPPGPAPPSA